MRSSAMWQSLFASDDMRASGIAASCSMKPASGNVLCRASLSSVSQCRSKTYVGAVSNGIIALLCSMWPGGQSAARRDARRSKPRVRHDARHGVRHGTVFGTFVQSSDMIAPFSAQRAFPKQCALRRTQSPFATESARFLSRFFLFWHKFAVVNDGGHLRKGFPHPENSATWGYAFS